MKLVKSAILMAVAGFSLLVWGCAGESRADGASPAEDEAADRPLVTFIELGSVRCVPCKMMQPVMEKVEERYKGQVKVIFYDVWTKEEGPKAKEFAIRVIPTQVFLDRDGREYFRHEGFFPFEELEKILKQKGVK